LSEDLARAIETKVEHVSAYGLTFEEGTPMREDLESDASRESKRRWNSDGTGR